MLLNNLFMTMCAALFLYCQCLCTHLNYSLGIEVLASGKQKILASEKIALFTNQSGKDSHGRRTIDILLAQKINLNRILVTEHGLEGTIPAECDVPDSHDASTGIPVFSLYERGKGKNIEKSLLDPVGTIIIDLQDSGMRHFTYISTLYTLLEAAKKFNKKIIILDRPNPLCDSMEGPLVDEDCRSFISIASIPLRHGMTMGELALYFNKYFFNSTCHITVIKMRHYNRTKGIGTTLPTPLSPNIKTIHSCYGYSFLGLLGEVRPFDVGIYQAKPFQVMMLPDKETNISKSQWQELSLLLEKNGVKTHLTKHTNNKRNISYTGLSVIIDDIAKVNAFQELLTIVEYMAKKGVPISIKPAGNKALGTHKLTLVLEKKLSRKKFIDGINKDLESFYTKAKSCFLYKPWPKIIKSY